MKGKILYSAHVITQMFKRGILEQDIEQVMDNGLIIREYPEDKPYPSYLILGFIESVPLHVVFAVNEMDEKIIVTAYQPDNSLWSNDFTIKRK